MRIREEQPRDGDLLCQPWADRRAARPENRVKPCRERSHGRPRVHGLEYRPQFVIAGVRAREPKVVAQRACKEMMFLGDQCDLAAKAIGWHEVS